MATLVWSTYICCLLAISMGDKDSPPCLNDKEPLQAILGLNLMTSVIQSCQQILNSHGNKSRKMETFEKEIGKMEQKLKAKDQELEKLKDNIEKLQIDFDNILKSRLSNLDEKVSNIEVNINFTLQTMKKECVEDMKMHDMKMSKLKSEMSTVTARIARIKDDITLAVSFSSYKTNILHDGQVGVPVVFEGVHDNYGNAYNTSTGIFTAPVNGTYFFYVSILSRNTYAEYKLYKEGVFILNFLTDRKSGYDEASGSVVIHLNKGSKVCVKPSYPDNGKFYVHYYMSNFSGFLVHRR